MQLILEYTQEEAASALAAMISDIETTEKLVQSLDKNEALQGTKARLEAHVVSLTSATRKLRKEIEGK